jgi:hypothetical protein
MRPDDLVARAERLTLDDVQRAPQLLLAVKRAGSTLLPIELKAAARLRVGDAKHLRTFRFGRRSRPGLVLQTGDAIEWLAPGVLAAPWWKVL